MIADLLKQTAIIIWVLALAVLLTIYGAWLLYPLEVDFLKISQIVYMTKNSIVYNFNGLMHYLTNPFIGQLDFASFRSSKVGLEHFKDVKWLFHFTQTVFLLLLIPVVQLISSMIKKRTLTLYHRFFIGAALFPIVIAVFATLIGFDNFFVLFHQILFAGKSNWSFDPLKDPVIWILPETFFMHCFLAFFVFYEMLALGLVILSRPSLKKEITTK